MTCPKNRAPWWLKLKSSGAGHTWNYFPTTSTLNVPSPPIVIHGQTDPCELWEKLTHPRTCSLPITASTLPWFLPSLLTFSSSCCCHLLLIPAHWHLESQRQQGREGREIEREDETSDSELVLFLPPFSTLCLSKGKKKREERVAVAPSTCYCCQIMIPLMCCWKLMVSLGLIKEMALQIMCLLPKSWVANCPWRTNLYCEESSRLI